MSAGPRTSSIARPKRAAAGRGGPNPGPRPGTRPDQTSDVTRFADFARPVAQDKRLIKGPTKRLAIAAIAAVVLLALMAVLFVLPVKSWFRQRDDIASRQRELAVLTAANAQVSADVNRLQTADGIREAAREEVGYVPAGGKRVSVMPLPQAPLTLPTGWPYDGVSQIIAVRAQQPAPTTTVASSTP
ncbi:MAG: septum formation initiator family protein [Ilumatobacteraceae bacterium]